MDFDDGGRDDNDDDECDGECDGGCNDDEGAFPRYLPLPSLELAVAAPLTLLRNLPLEVSAKQSECDVCGGVSSGDTCYQCRFPPVPLAGLHTIWDHTDGMYPMGCLSDQHTLSAVWSSCP